mmetsp:Transcript_31062/g.95969  ORF Transcript_31062/g.95969 Transcript_31062/m.95969 type:complete len:215 (-) Transcript_31062:713-1357(-)
MGSTVTFGHETSLGSTTTPELVATTPAVSSPFSSCSSRPKVPTTLLVKVTMTLSPRSTMVGAAARDSEADSAAGSPATDSDSPDAAAPIGRTSGRRSVIDGRSAASLPKASRNFTAASQGRPASTTAHSHTSWVMDHEKAAGRTVVVVDVFAWSRQCTAIAAGPAVCGVTRQRIWWTPSPSAAGTSSPGRTLPAASVRRAPKNTPVSARSTASG